MQCGVQLSWTFSFGFKQLFWLPPENEYKSCVCPPVPVEVTMAAYGVCFAIYYEVADRAFYRAALTYELESPYSSILKERVLTMSDFARAWRSVQARSESTGLPVHRGIIFSHASKGSSNDGLEFRAASDEDGTLSRSEIAALPKLNWHPEGELILAGCNTGVAGKRGWTPAGLFAKNQGVKTLGQAGYAYFSRISHSYSKIDATSQTVYLRAYKRGRNGAFGNGARMPEIEFSP
jgi:hypothetical protein